MGKGASKTGGAAGRKRTKDSAMAASMKDVPYDPIQHKCKLR